MAATDCASTKTLLGGMGDPIVLLHGFPQTHLMWRDVAADLMTDHTVICPDLRGYGDSDKPAATDETVYSKRTMANDVWRGRSGTRGSRSSVTTRAHS